MIDSTNSSNFKTKMSTIFGFAIQVICSLCDTEQDVSPLKYLGAVLLLICMSKFNGGKIRMKTDSVIGCLLTNSGSAVLHRMWSVYGGVLLWKMQFFR